MRRFGMPPLRLTNCLALLYLATLSLGFTSDLFLSTAQTVLLLNSERDLLSFVHQCLQQTALRTGNPDFSRLARELLADVNSLPQTQDARHPLDAYVGLRRFTDYWSKYITRMAPTVAKSVEKSLARNHLVYPDLEVLHQSRLAIVRLQAAYNLSSSHLLGSTNINLTSADVSSLAAEAKMSGFPSLAEGWKRLAKSYGWQSSVVDMPMPHSGASENDQVAEEVIAMQTKYAQFFSLCQRFQNSEDLTMLRSEGCVYTKGSMPLDRWKTEVLTSDPYIALYYDFITDREADIIVDKTMDKLMQAGTGSHPNDFNLKIHRRLGKMAWLTGRGSQVLTSVTRRIQEVTSLKAHYRKTGSFGEMFQVVNYGIGGQYVPHYDFFQANDMFKVADDYLKDSGDRAATFMIYLGDVSQGGATVFPKLGIGANPVKNAGLFWYNFTPDGQRDHRSLHGGCPVIIGQKWVINKWIHEISTAMTKSCGLHPLTSDDI